ILAGELAAELLREQTLVADVCADEEIGLTGEAEVEVRAVRPTLLPALPVKIRIHEILQAPRDELGLRLRIIADAPGAKRIVGVGALGEAYIGAIVARAPVAVESPAVMALGHVIDVRVGEAFVVEAAESERAG